MSDKPKRKGGQRKRDENGRALPYPGEDRSRPRPAKGVVRACLGDDLRNRLAAYAVVHGMSLSQVCAAAVREYLDGRA